MIETRITCDACGKEVGQEGTGDKGAYIVSTRNNPSGLVYAVIRTTKWVHCEDCWNFMKRALLERKGA